MKQTVEEHAARFDEQASDYDEDTPVEYEACANLVLEHASDGLDGEELVLDLGAGTGAIALGLADAAGEVVGRDISDGMLAEARQKRDERDLDNVSFGEGAFREPNYDGAVDVVVSNFAMHHLSDEEKRETVAVVDDLDPRRFVLGDVMLFGEADPSEPYYDPSVDDPSTVGLLVDALTDAGFVLTAVESVHQQVGVLVADRPGAVAPASVDPNAAERGSTETN